MVAKWLSKWTFWYMIILAYKSGTFPVFDEVNNLRSLIYMIKESIWCLYLAIVCHLWMITSLASRMKQALQHCVRVVQHVFNHVFPKFSLFLLFLWNGCHKIGTLCSLLMLFNPGCYRHKCQGPCYVFLTRYFLQESCSEKFLINNSASRSFGN